MTTAYADPPPRVVGIDLHRRRSVVVTKDAMTGVPAGPPVHVTNSAEALVAAVAPAGPGARVVLEATYGWYWAVDALRRAGFDVTLAHPSGCVGFKHRRVKNDEVDAADLADLLRLERLPEAWIAPVAVRELREMVRYRHTLVHKRTACKNQVHAVLAKNGLIGAASDLFGVAGRAWLDRRPLPRVYASEIASLLGLIDTLDGQVSEYDQRIAHTLAGDPGYRAVQTIPGVGPVLASIFVAEIGDVTRFASPAKLCSWAGLTPRHYESDITVHRGRITRQGSSLVRYAAGEAVQRQRQDNPITAIRGRVASRRPKQVSTVAAARKLLTYVYYALRDHHVRALRKPTGPCDRSGQPGREVPVPA
ncbi:IS110 family transposase [Mycobacterium sp.]|uniref:IS110 family transposase n=1 Tax=Mycobacterium sp. TaxID=1785 RepID=UPI00260A38E6|nr:IS110 family transposase [Mycobacterium sp.]